MSVFDFEPDVWFDRPSTTGQRFGLWWWTCAAYRLWLLLPYWSIAWPGHQRGFARYSGLDGSGTPQRGQIHDVHHKWRLGLWNDDTGKLFIYSSSHYTQVCLQELFTGKRPFIHLQSIPDIIDHIVNKELTRPSLGASFFRLTDEWWSICLSCLNRNPTHRDPMSNVVKKIRTLLVCGYLIPDVSDPRYYSFWDWIQGCHLFASMWCVFSFLSIIKIFVNELLQNQPFASLDLGNRVSRDESNLVGSSTHGIVYEGTLNPGQTKVAVKVFRYSDKGALPVLEVSSLYALSSLRCLIACIRNYSKKSMFGPNFATKMSPNYLGWQLLSIINYL